MTPDAVAWSFAWWAALLCLDVGAFAWFFVFGLVLEVVACAVRARIFHA